MKNRNVTFTTIFLALACFGLVPQMQAVVPPPDGCYPGFTTAEGCNALQFLGAGAGNTGVGWYSLYLVGDANFNTGVGAGTLVLNTGDSNTAVGAAALLLNTSGTANTAMGVDALVYNDTGGSNTATGAFALFSNTMGGANTATGASALHNNTTGSLNTAIGNGTLRTSMATDRNTAVGAYALQDDDVGERNTAIGVFALSSDTSGAFNTAVGVQALDSNTTGSINTALGVGAGGGVTTANNVICIGANVSGANVSNTAWIGNVFGTTTISGNTAPVIVSSTGQLGTMSSSRRFKDDIEPMDEASESILALKPVTFHYKSDNTNTPQFGLIAEDVAAVDSALIGRDKNGEIYTVRYEAVNAMLLNEFLKEHRKVKEQQAAITELKSVVAQQQKDFQAAIAEQRKDLEARLKQQDSRIRRVSDEVRLSKPAPQIAASDD